MIVAENVLEAIEARIADRHVLNHPFYQAWNRGELSREALQDYAAQYYQHVAAFPTYLSAVHSNTDDVETRRTLLMNLIDEEAGTPNHPQLWLQFAEGMGVEARRVDTLEGFADVFRAACARRGPMLIEFAID